ncbi:chymotrypsin-1-like [Onthophagus taurus]|uniref:chymotrypsin-1-like n=1 Tax=Onthophagus taurus TaxID=166361 RepID=UPI0039BDB59B
MNTNWLSFIFLLFLTTVLSQNEGNTTIDNNSVIVPETRIRNGDNINISQANYYVVVLCGGRGGGTLVRRNKVITAAHCVDETCTRNKVRVVVGLNALSNLPNGKTYRAKSIRIHPMYKKPAQGVSPYDIAVITLSEKVALNNRVGLINYAFNVPPIGAYLTVVGYGNINLDGVKPERLQRTRLRIIERPGTQIITEVQSSSVLKGDSGGPAIYNNRLAGVVSGYTSRNGIVETNIFVAVGKKAILTFIRRNIP